MVAGPARTRETIPCAGRRCDPVLSKYFNCATVAAIFVGFGKGNGRWRIADAVAMLWR
jgi:hypothetical protein